ncbi:MAG: zinc-ribbon domain-containing protein [Pseudomonadota bacterium]
MRLTCPNCGAQYAVDPTVIPKEGRDVQCSSCGNTWFQVHPDAEGAAEAVPVEDTLPHRKPNPEAMSILREEAARERAARAAERAPLESQPELDVATPGGGRSGEAPASARVTAAERTKADVSPISDADRAKKAAPRRSLLPDIEEINTAIAADPEHGEDLTPIATANRRAREAAGRRMGFGIAVGIFAALTMLYSQGPRIAAAVPAFAPALIAYVGTIDRGRIWLDGALRAAVTPSADEPESAATEG